MRKRIQAIIGRFILLGLVAGSAFGAEKGVSLADLKEKLKFYRSIQELEVRFHQTKKLQDAGMEIQSEGMLHVLPHETVVWEITKPAPLKITLTPAGVEIRSGTNESPTIQKYPASQMPKETGSSGFQSLGAWMSLDAEKLSSQYKIEEAGERTFLFTPKKEGAFQFQSLKMSLTKEGHLENLTLFERSGDQMLLKFDSPKVKQKKEGTKK